MIGRCRRKPSTPLCRTCVTQNQKGGAEFKFRQGAPGTEVYRTQSISKYKDLLALTSLLWLSFCTVPEYHGRVHFSILPFCTYPDAAELALSADSP